MSETFGNMESLGKMSALRRWESAANTIDANKTLQHQQGWFNLLVMVLAPVLLVLTLVSSDVSSGLKIVKIAILGIVLLLAWVNFLQGVLQPPASQQGKRSYFEKAQIRDLFHEFIASLDQDQIPDEMRTGWRVTHNPRVMILKVGSLGLTYKCSLDLENGYKFDVRGSSQMEYDPRNLRTLANRMSALVSEEYPTFKDSAFSGATAWPPPSV